MTCCVLSPQEERLKNAKVANPRERTNALLKGFREQTPRIDTQRAVLFTESMQQTEAYPLNLRWAKALKHICENIDVVAAVQAVMQFYIQSYGLAGTKKDYLILKKRMLLTFQMKQSKKLWKRLFLIGKAEPVMRCIWPLWIQKRERLFMAMMIMVLLA